MTSCIETIKTKCDDNQKAEASKKLKLDDGMDNDESIDNNDEETHSQLVESQLEQACGIMCRINMANKRFRGLFKYLATDFIVNEIDLDGNVVRLTSLSDEPAIDEADNDDVEQQQHKNDNENKSNETFEQASETIKTIIGDELVYNNLISFLNAEQTNESLQIQAPKNKDDRKKLHEFLKTYFKSFTSNTINQKKNDNESKDETIQLIEINHCKNNRRSSSRDCFRSNSERSNDPMSKYKIIECCMYKENIDTIQAVNLTAKYLRINAKRIGFAGTKDKRAKTSQLISLFKVDPKQIMRLNSQLNNIKLGNLKYKRDGGLKLGDLSGNRFKLVIRELDENNETSIAEQIEQFKANGFINYFGLQRFGNSAEVSTQSIGKLLIKNQIKEAIELILKPRSDSNEKEAIRRAREIWLANKNEPHKALVYLERTNCVEKFILKGLSNSNANDYLGAFQFLPRNMRLMYLHAYQSYIWNFAASKRLEMYGMKPQIGDLVRKTVENKRNKNKHLADRKANVNECQEENVIFVDESNINDYSIYDVVLPLPGFDVLYPKNEIKPYYEELLSKDGIKIDGFKNKIKDFSLSGDYRTIVVKPGDLNYEIRNYTDKNEHLTKSDWELLDQELKNVEPLNQSKMESSETFKGLVIEFNLPSSCYATVALRELLNS